MRQAIRGLFRLRGTAVLGCLGGVLVLAQATRHGVGITPDSVVYLEAAQNLAAGRGLATADDGAELRPLTRFPPGYPVAIALVASLGPAFLDAARWLALALLGANVVLVALLIARSAPGARWLPAPPRPSPRCGPAPPALLRTQPKKPTPSVAGPSSI